MLIGDRKQQSYEPRIVAFLCNWCAYAGADLAGTQRLSYPPNVRVIRLMCSGRVDPGFIIEAFLEGADGVIVAGCHPGECHYEHGNRLAERRMTTLQHLLGFIGIEQARVRLAWVSAAEGRKFAQLIETTVEEVRALGPFQQFPRRAP
ncbi:MAG: hydrogenase iron-sulfur subunit [Gammaproteobacteria bacterium]|nr:hydrogenase iron-sulfur subunit [Gammaproteobacteria bacterium]